MKIPEGGELAGDEELEVVPGRGHLPPPPQIHPFAGDDDDDNLILNDDLNEDRNDVDDEDEVNEEEEEQVHEQRFFKEPLYIQRYAYVMELLQQNRWKRHLRRLVDVGANDCGFLFRLRNSCGMRFLREVIALDVDEDVLLRGRERTAALMSASLIKDQQRPFFPCDVYHMVGSVADQDPRLKDVDVVVGIEVIEHLHAPTLDRLPESVFGHMRPKLAVFTTPNSEFNVLFGPSFEGPFRHWDHKFEWTRQEFREWARDITRRYPGYKVEFSGVGEPPFDEKSEEQEKIDRGPCTQIAVFLRQDFEEAANGGDFAHKEECSRIDQQINLVSNHREGGAGEEGVGPYKTVVHHHYPRHFDDRDLNQRAFDSVCDEILTLHYSHCQNSDEGEEGEEQRSPKVYCHQLEDVLERRCYDDYGDPYQITHQQLRDIVVSLGGDGFGCGEDEIGGGIYFTVNEEYWKSADDDDDGENSSSQDNEDNGNPFDQEEDNLEMHNVAAADGDEVWDDTDQVNVGHGNDDWQENR